MKRFFFLASVAFAFGTSLNAQTVIKNNYDNNSATSINVQTPDDDRDEMISSVNFAYYSFKGGSNYGLADYFLNPNGVGGEFAIRTDFKKYGNYNIDLGVNYSFKLWAQDKSKLMLVVAAGPSFRMQDIPEYKYNSKTGSVSTEDKTKFFIDLYINPRLAFHAGKFNLAAGYYLWSAKWKFSNGAALHGFNASIGFNF